MKKAEIIIKDTHRGLWYEDGVLTKVLETGRYEIPKREGLLGRKGPLVEVVLVEMRERDLTIKGQEILTADKADRLRAAHPGGRFFPPTRQLLLRPPRPLSSSKTASVRSPRFIT